MIFVENLYLKYPNSNIEVLQDMSFNVKEGEIIGFLGPSGAGKSTLQKVLVGMLRKYSGNVKVFDTEIENRTTEYYENVGMVFEFPNFYNKFTGLENLEFFSSLYKTPSIDIMPLIERVGLVDDMNKRVSSYSKGMKMRLNFVRSLLHNPKLLFLDEPTSGLDPKNARIVKEIILEQKSIGKTLILTTHNMYDADELCDRVAFIVDGKIIAMDTPSKLKEKGKDTEVEYSYMDGVKKKSSSLLSELNQDDIFITALETNSITNIHTKENTLEDVFISLTGRSLI